MLSTRDWNSENAGLVVHGPARVEGARGEGQVLLAAPRVRLLPHLQKNI